MLRWRGDVAARGGLPTCVWDSDRSRLPSEAMEASATSASTCSAEREDSSRTGFCCCGVFVVELFPSLCSDAEPECDAAGLRAAVTTAVPDAACHAGLGGDAWRASRSSFSAPEDSKLEISARLAACEGRAQRGSVAEIDCSTLCSLAGPAHQVLLANGSHAFRRVLRHIKQGCGPVQWLCDLHLPSSCAVAKQEPSREYLHSPLLLRGLRHFRDKGACVKVSLPCIIQHQATSAGPCHESQDQCCHGDAG